MPDFETFLMRHSEFVVQTIVEQIERNEGICASLEKSLEERWNALMWDVSRHWGELVV